MRRLIQDSPTQRAGEREMSEGLIVRFAVEEGVACCDNIALGVMTKGTR